MCYPNNPRDTDAWLASNAGFSPSPDNPYLYGATHSPRPLHESIEWQDPAPFVREKPKRSALAAKPKGKLARVAAFAMAGVAVAALLVCALGMVASLILVFGKQWGIENGGGFFILILAVGVPLLGAIIGALFGARGGTYGN